MKTEVVQKAIVLNSKGQLLALRRSKTDIRRPGQWDLPGGMLDAGETLEHGVMREIKEEADIRVNEVRPLYCYTDKTHWVDDNGSHEINVIRIFYVAHISSNDSVALSHEHDEYAWLSFEEAKQQFTYDKHLQLFEYIQENNLL